MEAALGTVEAGLAFGWLPEPLVRGSVELGTVKPLPLINGATRNVALSLVLVNADLAGPAARAALEAFQRHRPLAQLERAVP